MNETDASSYKTEYSEKVSKFLDELGKAIPDELFSGINNYYIKNLKVDPEYHRHLLEHLQIGFSFVFDTNSIQEILRRILRDQNSDVFDGIRVGRFVALAPFKADYEIAEHIKDIAKDCGKSPLETLKIYHDVVRPHIHFLSIKNIETLENIRRKIRDEDDAPFVVLYLEEKPLGIVTRDNDIKEFEGTKCFELKDLGQIHVDGRKRETAIIIIFSIILMIWGFVKLIFGFFKNILNFMKEHPWLSLIFLLTAIFGFFLICYKISDRTKLYLIQKWKHFKTDCKELLSSIGPYVGEFLIQLLQRVSDSNVKTEQLLQSKTEGGTPLRFKNDQLYEALTLEQVIKHIFLALRRPLTSKEVSDSLNYLGIKTESEKGLNYEVAKVLRQKSSFLHKSSGYIYFPHT
jgi:hypothetical protein